MKKNILSLALTLALVAGTFVGCGCNTTNEKNTTTNETSTNEEVSTEENTTSDSGNVGDITDENESETNTEKDTSKEVKVGTYTFPTKNGFTEKILATEYDENADPNWSYNKTYGVANNGRDVYVAWNGPASLGQKAWTNETTIILSDNAQNYKIWFCNGEDITKETYNLWLADTKETWISFAPSGYSYIENGYYKLTENDEKNLFTVIYAISNDEYKGYRVHITNLKKGLYYECAYVEKVSIYDDTRAWNTINSLEIISKDDFNTDTFKDLN